MKTMYLTEEDKKNNPKVIHGFDLRDFSKLTVFKLLEFIDKPHVVRKIKDYNEAYELYRLADYLNYTDLIEALIPIFVSLLDFKKSVQLLIDEKLLPEDSELFVDLAINQLLKDERQLIFTLSKYEIKLPYFLKLARRAIGNHSRLFNYTLMMEYAHRYSKSLNLSMKDVIYKGEVGERFFDLIPFKVLHIDDFLDIFCKTKILHSDDIKTLSPQIRDNKKLDTFEFKEARNGKLYWNLTSEKVRSLSDRNEVASPEFSYNNVREYYIHFLNMDGYYWIGMRADLVNYVSIYDTPLEGGIITIHNNGNVTKMMHRIKIQEVEKILIANNRCLEIEIQLK